MSFGMICHTAGHQYTNLHANIHMYAKVIAILSFLVAAILKIQNEGRSSSQLTCPHFLYDLIIANYQYTKFHAFMAI